VASAKFLRARVTNLQDCGFLSFQSAIGISITARCPIACDHCIVKADRNRTDEMTPAMVAGILDGCAGVDRSPDEGLGAVIFTGGEPFFSRALLKSALQLAASRGLLPVVVTNAYWATTEEAANDILRELPEIGMLTFSTDRFHQKFVALDKIRNAIAAAERLAIPFRIAVCADNVEELARVRSQLDGVADPDLVLPSITLPTGRRAESSGPLPEPEPDSLKGRCTGAECPVVFPDGRVIACMGMVNGLPPGHPLLLGNVLRTPMGKLLLAAQDNIFLHAMRSLGPTHFLAPSPAPPGLSLPRHYLAYGTCALCYAIAQDPALLAQLRARLQDPDLAEHIAYARLYYLHEDWMARKIQSPEATDERHG
jgi:organic radical activating enzyme